MLIILQSCDAQFGQAGPTPTLGPDDFSLCQYLGLASEVSEAGPIETIPATPSVQSSELTGQYPDIEFIPIYPGAVPDGTNAYYDNTVDGKGRTLRVIAAADTNTVLQFYKDALSQNGWVSADDASPIIGSLGGTYISADPVSALPWSMKLELAIYDAPIPTSTVEHTRVLIWYTRFPNIGKGLAVYPTASNIVTTCSENMTIKIPVKDATYKGTIQKSYVTQASSEEVAAYYKTVLPIYGWRLLDDGTYYSRVPVDPSLIEFSASMQVKITSVNGGGTKVELTQSITRITAPGL